MLLLFCKRSYFTIFLHFIFIVYIYFIFISWVSSYFDVHCNMEEHILILLLFVLLLLA